MFTLDPHNKDFIATVDLLLKALGGAGAFYLFFVGLARYKKDQIWKCNEFVAKEIKEFTTDPIVKVVMSILDWGNRYVELFPDKPNYDDRFVRIDRTILKMALQYHEFRLVNAENIRFTRAEVAIRDYFDHFLSYFERFDQFVVAGLITKKELEPYLKYWIFVISEDLELDVRNYMYHYIDKYGYTGMRHLFQAFGKNIFPFSNIETTKTVDENPIVSST